MCATFLSVISVFICYNWQCAPRPSDVRHSRSRCRSVIPPRGLHVGCDLTGGLYDTPSTSLRHRRAILDYFAYKQAKCCRRPRKRMAFSDCHLRTAMPYFRSVLEDPNGTFREFNVWCTSRQSLSILLPLIGGATMVRTPFKACGDRERRRAEFDCPIDHWHWSSSAENLSTRSV